MREIKFRNWDEHHKTMTYDVIPVGQIAYVKSDEAEWDNTLTLVGPSSILMQYTGLKDKKGVELYEGDILAPGLEVKWSDTKAQFVVIMEFMEFFGKHEFSLERMTTEAIGNIYKNPELLAPTEETEA